MLTVSREAVSLLITAREESDIPADAALRVARPSDGTDAGITLGFVDRPYQGDEVGDAHGLPVCVAPDIAPQLDTSMLDVVEEHGEPRLVLVPATEAT